MNQTPESAAGLWKKTGLAVLSAAAPFALLASPETTGWLIQNEWVMRCLAAVGGLGLAAGTVKLHDRFRQNLGEFIGDGVWSAGFAAAATWGLLKTAEWNMAGDLMANGWIRAGEVGGGIAVGFFASKAIWNRWQARRSAAALAEAERVDAQNLRRYYEIKARVEGNKTKRAAREILYEAMDAIKKNEGAVTEEARKKMANLALRAAQGDAKAEEELLFFEKAAITAGERIKAGMVSPDGRTIDYEAIESLARPQIEAKKIWAWGFQLLNPRKDP